MSTAQPGGEGEKNERRRRQKTCVTICHFEIIPECLWNHEIDTLIAALQILSYLKLSDGLYSSALQHTWTSEDSNGELSRYILYHYYETVIYYDTMYHTYFIFDIWRVAVSIHSLLDKPVCMKI